MKGTLPNCVTCGRFCTCESGASWRMVYSGGPIFQAIRDELKPRPDNVFHLSREGS